MKKKRKGNETKELATELGSWHLILWSVILFAAGIIFLLAGIAKLAYGEIALGIVLTPSGIILTIAGIWTYKKVRKSA